MKHQFSANIPDTTYFRTGDAEPEIETDDSITLFDGRGGRRSWGAPQVNTTVLVDTEDFLSVLVGFSHKHGGSQFYRHYVNTSAGPMRRTWAKLTDDERALILAAYQDKAPAWANRPGKLSTERVKPADASFEAYKLLRRLPDGRLLSFYAATEWTIGKTMVEAAQENHGGGYYVHPDWITMRELWLAGKLIPEVPGEFEQVVVRCECRGCRVEYSSGKVAVTYCKPVEIMEVWS